MSLLRSAPGPDPARAVALLLALAVGSLVLSVQLAPSVNAAPDVATAVSLSAKKTRVTLSSVRSEPRLQAPVLQEEVVLGCTRGQ